MRDEILLRFKKLKLKPWSHINICMACTTLACRKNSLAYICTLCIRLVAPWAFGVTLGVTSYYLIVKDFIDTPNKGKINNNISCSYEVFYILIKVFTYAFSFSLIIKEGHKKTHIIQTNNSTLLLKF